VLIERASRRHRIGAALVAAAAPLGCFAPAPQVGLPCGPGETCPAGQECRAGTCERPIAPIDAPDPDPADGGPPRIDAASLPPDARVDCWDQWLAGTPAFGAVVELAELSTATEDGDPFVTPDGLTLYFTRGTGLGRDIYVTSRPDRGSPFAPASLVAALSGPTDDTRVAMTADGLVAALSRRTSAGDFDLYQAARASVADPFGPPTTAAFAGLNNAGNQYDPWLTQDGLRLYFAPTVGLGLGQELRVASRASRLVPFQPGVALAGITPAIAVDPTLSPDERVLVYAGTTIIAGPNDLYTARRAGTGETFTGVTALAALNTAGVEADPSLPADGCELVFVSDRGAGGDRDLFIADVVVPAP
jgi:hypothetical protein